jgi:hypothetical protein
VEGELKMNTITTQMDELITQIARSLVDTNLRPLTICEIFSIFFMQHLGKLEQVLWKVSGKFSAGQILGLDRSTLNACIRKLNIRKP